MLWRFLARRRRVLTALLVPLAAFASVISTPTAPRASGPLEAAARGRPRAAAGGIDGRFLVVRGLGAWFSAARGLRRENEELRIEVERLRREMQESRDAQPATPRPIATATRQPAATVVARPTATPAGKVSTWEFDRPIDGSWYAEGGVDATVGIEARPGYLRITAPSGNDLFPGTNYDTPTVFQVVSGDFTVETALEFVPTEDYQGAGLFIWQDQDNFVRLERCFGGLGGIDSGICLLKIADGEPEVIASPVDIPTTAQRVELRLQKAGEQVTASWREASAASAGPWRTAGKMEIALPGGPQPMMDQGLRTGMLLCVEQGAAEISADFDVFRIRSE